MSRFQMIVLKTVGARNCYFATNAGVTDIHEKKKNKKKTPTSVHVGYLFKG